MFESDRSSHVVTLELVRTLDETETAVQLSWSESLKRQEGNPLDVEIKHFEGAVGFVARNVKTPSFNRVMRVATEHKDLLEQIVAWYRDQGVVCTIETVPHLADEPLLQELTRLGLAVTEFNTVFYAFPTSDLPPPPTSIDVKTYVGDDLNEFAALYATLFPNLSASKKEAFQQETVARHSLPGWRCYLAWVGGELGAYSRMYVNGETASFSGAMSLPTFRGRGLQAALLRQRTVEARDLGCNLLVSQAMPGTTSQRNMERAGFRVAYNKVKWVDSR
ncbi:MAG: hypothetical protein AAF267_01590 [Deinococcota bacterium]